MGRGRGGGGYGGGGGGSFGGGGCGGAAPAEPQPEDNNRIYITGLPPDVTEDELATYFGQLGTVMRKKQKRGFPDQWPWKISIYKDDSGRKCKGDGTLSYEDPNAAQSAKNFFDGQELRKGVKIHVEMAEQKSYDEPAATEPGGGRRRRRRRRQLRRRRRRLRRRHGPWSWRWRWRLRRRRRRWRIRRRQ